MPSSRDSFRRGVVARRLSMVVLRGLQNSRRILRPWLAPRTLAKRLLDVRGLGLDLARWCVTAASGPEQCDTASNLRVRSTESCVRIGDVDRAPASRYGLSLSVSDDLPCGKPPRPGQRSWPASSKRFRNFPRPVRSLAPAPVWLFMACPRCDQCSLPVADSHSGTQRLSSDLRSPSGFLNPFGS